jgi:DNA-binding transcriptional MerR regulator
MSIGEFARRSRLSLKALRLYEGLGLVVPDSIDPVTGYRRYLGKHAGPGPAGRDARRLDTPLATVAEVVAAPRPFGADLLVAYWESVEHRIASQRELAAHLRIRLSNGEGVSAMVDEVRQREVPEHSWC